MTNSLPIDAVAQHLEETRDQRVAELQELLRIPSVSAVSGHHDDCRTAAQWVHEQLAACGFATETVKTDGLPVELPVGEVTLPAERRYSACPAVSQSTYVIGVMRNQAGFPLLPGPVRVFLGGSFIGKSEMDFVAANERFGQVVLGHYSPGDMVWVQDYHLMLLPQILKSAHGKMKVGLGYSWFLLFFCCVLS